MDSIQTHSITNSIPPNTTPRILAIDDEQEILTLVDKVLSQNFDVITLNNPQLALNRIESCNPTILLIDNMMPVLTGFDLARQIRNNHKFDHIPILMLTAYGVEEIRIKAYASGVDDFITKPFNATELIAKIEAWARLSDRVSLLLKQNEKLTTLAYYDSLTNVTSRMHGLTLLNNEIERQKRYNTPLGIIILDIDNFKGINDTYGHNTGDGVLRLVAQTIQSTLRVNDSIIRYGGDEFLLILPHAKEEALTSICDKIVNQEFSLSIDKNTAISVTLSLGGTSVCEKNISAEELIEKADMALLSAKQSGKNQYKICS
jgi:diguanylate cyclase (GGDEF)-like protein